MGKHVLEGFFLLIHDTYYYQCIPGRARVRLPTNWCAHFCGRCIVIHNQRHYSIKEKDVIYCRQHHPKNLSNQASIHQMVVDVDCCVCAKTRETSFDSFHSVHDFTINDLAMRNESRWRRKKSHQELKATWNCKIQSADDLYMPTRISMECSVYLLLVQYPISSFVILHAPEIWVREN